MQGWVFLIWCFLPLLILFWAACGLKKRAAVVRKHLKNKRSETKGDERAMLNLISQFIGKNAIFSRWKSNIRALSKALRKIGSSSGTAILIRGKSSTSSMSWVSANARRRQRKRRGKNKISEVIPLKIKAVSVKETAFLLDERLLFFGLQIFN